MKHWLSLPVSKRPKDNKLYETLVKHYLDVSVTAKLHFIKFIASLFQEFLVSFQSDKPFGLIFVKSVWECHQKNNKDICFARLYRKGNHTK